MALTLVDAALRGGLIALLLLVATALLPLRRHERYAHLVGIGIALCASLAVQTFAASHWAEYELACVLQAPGVGVSLGSAVLFWLFAQAMFSDDFRLRPWHGGVWLGVSALGAGLCAWKSWPAPAPVLGFTLMRAVPIIFTGLTGLAVAAQWRVDLIERRRRWRGLIVGGGGLYALVMVVLRLRSEDGRLGPAAGLSDVAMLLALVAVMAWRVLEPRRAGLWGEGEPPAVSNAPAAPAPPAAPELQPPAPDAQDDRLQLELRAWMDLGRGYAQEGLSLAGLAERLHTPEYRLRRVINQRLGHRNFNAFVNSLRLAEARRRLADPAERALPVLSIALDVGFGSIGPFNRAFKAETGLTPTEFRQRATSESRAET